MDGPGQSRREFAPAGGWPATRGARHGEPSPLRSYLHVVARHRWLVLAATLLVPLVAVLLSLRQERLYEASAEVLLSRQNLAATLTGTQDPSVYQQADRIAQTQADLARVPTVAERTLAAAGVTDRTPGEFLDASSASPRPDADLLEFHVTDPSPPLAAKLANEYAKQFTLFRLELDTSALQRARAEVEDRIDELEAVGGTGSELYASLAEKEQQLGTMEALQTSNAYVVRNAEGAVQVQPQPVRDGLLGAGVGLALGIALAFLRRALDTKVRSAEEVRGGLGMPLLGRLPGPPRALRASHRLVMLNEPSGTNAEAFRMLRTNLDFMNLERGARSIMVTSALQGEGKSTTIANLAVALARAGRRVILVDLDLRRPSIHRFFDLESRPGITDVALGQVDLDRALVRLSVGKPGPKSTGVNGHADVEGVFGVLPAGSLPPDVGEFVGTRRLAGILEALAERADLVLVDTPPLLSVGDALELSARVDALLVVARLGAVRHGTLAELARTLEGSPAPALGVIVTDAASEKSYGGSYGYAYGYSSAREQEPVA